MRISDLKIGQRARIVAIEQTGSALYRKRLIAMGVLPGTEFTVTRIAPLGDPVELSIRGFLLSIRKSEASILEVKLI